MSSLKRTALVFGILSLLLFADGSYLLATHKNPNGDTGILFGNPHNFLSSGTIVVISALFLLVATVIMWLVAVHREDKERQAAERSPVSKPTGQSGRTASKA